MNSYKRLPMFTEPIHFLIILAGGSNLRVHYTYAPKQAFRVEIVDQFDVPVDLQDNLHGLLRWHIFLQDWRGKSVRGMITPRLYLNRILLPYANLTFSTHDSISLRNSDFVRLLRDPKTFLKYWEKEKRRHAGVAGEQPGLWDESSDGGQS